MNQKSEFLILIYGGQSTEHDISRRSACTIYQNLNTSKYTPILIGIDESSNWWLQEKDNIQIKDSMVEIIKKHQIDPGFLLKYQDSGVVFPIIHGRGGEDGTLYGMLECMNMCFVGCGCLGAAIGMNKIISKKLVSSAGIRVVPYFTINSYEWMKFKSQSNYDVFKEKITTVLEGWPVFIKPASQGSSVGISKVKDFDEFIKGVEDAFLYDTDLLVEKAFNVREIECAVLGGNNPKCSVPGEVITEVGFYDYSAKYKTNTSRIQIPADLSQNDVDLLKKDSIAIFKTLNLESMSRVDFFFNKDDGLYYFNEVNTVPGFTSISQYPKLWEYEGLSLSKLLDELINIGKERFKKSKEIVKSFKI